MINEARKLASHPVTYINSNGTLYRSKDDCLFPSRCQGVEHFLLKLSPKLPDFEIVINNHDWPYVKKYVVSQLFEMVSIKFILELFPNSCQIWFNLSLD